MSERRVRTWRCVAATVRGAAHARGKDPLPNQDALLCEPTATASAGAEQSYTDSGDARSLVLAISDGHGSAKSFRSDQGSKLAVEVAVEVLKATARALGEWHGDPAAADDGPPSAGSVRRSIGPDTGPVEGAGPPPTSDGAVGGSADDGPPAADSSPNLSASDKWIGPQRQRIPGQIVLRWRERVKEHWLSHPLTKAEEEHFLAAAGEGGLQEFKRALQELLSVPSGAPSGGAVAAGSDTGPLPAFVPYGATLLAVLLTERVAVYVQLGDGDVMTVTVARPVEGSAPGGEAFRYQVERIEALRDKKLFANETTSLCAKTALTDMRVLMSALQTTAESLPAMILLSTDGYSNSFKDEASFRNVGAVLCENVRTAQLTKVAEHLKEWLQEATEKGAGDDTTLGVIFRSDAFDPISAAEAALRQSDSARGAKPGHTPPHAGAGAVSGLALSLFRVVDSLPGLLALLCLFAAMAYRHRDVLQAQAATHLWPLGLLALGAVLVVRIALRIEHRLWHHIRAHHDVRAQPGVRTHQGRDSRPAVPAVASHPTMPKNQSPPRTLPRI